MKKNQFQIYAYVCVVFIIICGIDAIKVPPCSCMYNPVLAELHLQTTVLGSVLLLQADITWHHKPCPVQNGNAWRTMCITQQGLVC